MVKPMTIMTIMTVLKENVLTLRKKTALFFRRRIFNSPVSFQFERYARP
jgi:hypothetical protein